MQSPHESYYESKRMSHFLIYESYKGAQERRAGETMIKNHSRYELIFEEQNFENNFFFRFCISKSN